MNFEMFESDTTSGDVRKLNNKKTIVVTAKANYRVGEKKFFLKLTQVCLVSNESGFYRGYIENEKGDVVAIIQQTLFTYNQKISIKICNQEFEKFLRDITSLKDFTKKKFVKDKLPLESFFIVKEIFDEEERDER